MKVKGRLGIFRVFVGGRRPGGGALVPVGAGLCLDCVRTRHVMPGICAEVALAGVAGVVLAE